MTLPTERRRGFTPKQRATIFDGQAGLCALCSTALAPGWHVDHRVPLAFGGNHDPENWRGLCVPCHTQITRDQAPRFAKVRRILKWSEPREPSRIKSRPFPKHLTKGFDNKVRPRKGFSTEESE